jgi:hypothetical protein
MAREEVFICKLCLDMERAGLDDGTGLCEECQRAMNLSELPTEEQMAFIRRQESEAEAYLQRRG